MTLTFGSWIGIPAVPFVTLYRYRVQRFSTNKSRNQECLNFSEIFSPGFFSIRMINNNTFGFYPLQDATRHRGPAAGRPRPSEPQREARLPPAVVRHAQPRTEPGAVVQIRDSYLG